VLLFVSPAILVHSFKDAPESLQDDDYKSINLKQSYNFIVRSNVCLVVHRSLGGPL
jgi:hypothetical protein